jgi:hypothetical protein
MIELGHEEALAELGAVALDSAPPDVIEAVRAHAAVCPECGPELAAMDATVATLGHLVPAARMNRGRSAGIRSRLVMRGRSEREAQSAPAPGRPDLMRGVASLTGLGHKVTPGAQRVVTGETRRVTPAGTPKQADFEREPRFRSMNWWGIAATVALVITGGQLMRVTSERNEIRDRAVAVDTLAPHADSLQSIVAQKDAMLEAITGPDVKTVPLTNRTARDPLGRMMWNRATNDWVMVTYGLRQPRQGMTYQVWLITDDAKISAGTFTPDDKGNSMMRANYALPREALRAVAVTEEPEGGVPSPTGPMVIAGSA